MGQTALQFLAITQSFCKAKETMLIAFSISRLTSGRKKKTTFPGGKTKVTVDINYSMLMNGCYTCVSWSGVGDCARSPFYKYAGLNGVDDAAEARFLFVAPQHQAHLASEGGGQPVPHLRRHRLRLDVAQLVLGVHQTPGRRSGEREGGAKQKHGK